MSPEEQRFGRNANRPIGKSPEDHIGEAREKIAETVRPALDVAASASDAFAQVTSYRFKATLNTLKSRTTLAAAGISVAVAGAGIYGLHYMRGDQVILRLDGQAADKCFSLYNRSGLKAPAGEQEMRRTFDLMRGFGAYGAESADRLENSDYTFCYGIENPDGARKEHWQHYRVYFFGADYPIELAALTLASRHKQAYWAKKTVPPGQIRSYVPESGLVFSRARAAAMAAEDIRNVYRSLEHNRKAKNTMDSPEWQVFLEENPALEKTLQTYLSSMTENHNEAAAMGASMEIHMQDPVAIEKNDTEYLSAYQNHVRNIQTSDHVYIYTKGGYFGADDYAFIDADRDGIKNDLVKLERKGGYRAADYQFDYGTSKSGFSHKKESYSCDVPDGDGGTIMQTCWRNVVSTVYFTMIPAKDAASVHMDPQTLVDLAALTGTDYLGRDTASRMAHDFSFAQAYGPNIALMEMVKSNQAQYIPEGRDTGTAQRGLGLR
ncbi:MAG: hypothetical protein WC989_07735 [Micavibrio sp.]